MPVCKLLDYLSIMPSDDKSEDKSAGQSTGDGNLTVSQATMIPAAMAVTNLKTISKV